MLAQATPRSAAANQLASGDVPSAPLGFGTGASVGSMPGGKNVPDGNGTSTGGAAFVPGGTRATSVPVTQGFVSSVVADGMTTGSATGGANAATGSTGSATGGAGAATGGAGAAMGSGGPSKVVSGVTGAGPVPSSKVVPGVVAGGSGALTGGAGAAGASAAGSTSTSAGISNAAANERPSLLAPATPAPVAANPVQPQQPVTGVAGGATAAPVTMSTQPGNGQRSSFVAVGGAGTTAQTGRGAASGAAMDAYIPGRRLLRH